MRRSKRLFRFCDVRRQHASRNTPLTTRLDHMSSSVDAIASLLGQIPSGLCILTARYHETEETGMLVSWVQQAAFNPPAVTIAINKSRFLHDWLSPGSPVALNLLGESQKQMLGHFGKGFEPGAPAFTNLSLERSPHGLPVLREALGWMEGIVSSKLDAGDHSILLVPLSAGGSGTLTGSVRPWVHLRKSGLHY